MTTWTVEHRAAPLLRSKSWQNVCHTCDCVSSAVVTSLLPACALLSPSRLVIEKTRAHQYLNFRIIICSTTIMQTHHTELIRTVCRFFLVSVINDVMTLSNWHAVLLVRPSYIDCLSRKKFAHRISFYLIIGLLLVSPVMWNIFIGILISDKEKSKLRILYSTQLWALFESIFG